MRATTRLYSSALLGCLAAVCNRSARRTPAADVAATDPFVGARMRMVARQIVSRGITDARLLDAMRRVPRHAFVPYALRVESYVDEPLPIGHEQTISQPYIAALMTELARVAPTDRVLEIGTGSGYQTALLSLLAREVYTIEIVAPLGVAARERLLRLGYRNLHTRIGDGYLGWTEAAPFDVVLVTAAPLEIPPRLLEQLAVGGRLVAPLGPVGEDQRLVVVTRTLDGLRWRDVTAVRFVPMRRDADAR